MKSERVSALHTAGALHAAEIIMRGGRKISTGYRRKTVIGIADLIEIETGLKELLLAAKCAEADLAGFCLDSDIAVDIEGEPLDKDVQHPAAITVRMLRAAIANTERMKR